MVTLGRWSSREGGFGGFADKPETYQIRQLLKLAKTQPTARDQNNKDPWELIKDPIYIQTEVQVYNYWRKVKMN
jgi:hypothetical protein